MRICEEEEIIWINFYGASCIAHPESCTMHQSAFRYRGRSPTFSIPKSKINYPIPSFTLAMKSWLARMRRPFVLPSVAN